MKLKNSDLIGRGLRIIGQSLLFGCVIFAAITWLLLFAAIIRVGC